MSAQSTGPIRVTIKPSEQLMEEELMSNIEKKIDALLHSQYLSDAKKEQTMSEAMEGRLPFTFEEWLDR